MGAQTNIDEMRARIEARRAAEARGEVFPVEIVREPKRASPPVTIDEQRRMSKVVQIASGSGALDEASVDLVLRVVSLLSTEQGRADSAVLRWILDKLPAVKLRARTEALTQAAAEPALLPDGSTPRNRMTPTRRADGALAELLGAWRAIALVVHGRRVP